MTIHTTRPAFKPALLAFSLACLFIQGPRAHASTELPASLNALNAMAAQTLPQPDLGRQSIEDSLIHQQGIQESAIQRAEARIRKAGDHEWIVSSAMRNRRFRDEGVSRQDYELGLSRALRWPGKANLDQQIAGQQTALADTLLEDSWHEASRNLADAVGQCRLRYAVLNVHTRNEAEQTAFVEQQTRRFRLGDIAEVALIQSQIELKLIAQQRRQALMDLQAAQLALNTQYPALSAYADSGCGPGLATHSPWATLGEPDMTLLRNRLVTEHHGLRLLEQRAQIASMDATRQRMDQRADPTLGLTLATEQNNAERIAGLHVSIPLGGTVREAKTAVASARSTQLQIELTQTRRLVNQQAALTVTQYTAKLDKAQQAQQQLAQQEDQYQRLLKAYRLGEVTHTELNLTRQALMQARQQYAEAVNALETHAVLMMIDAHLLLQMDNEH